MDGRPLFSIGLMTSLLDIKHFKECTVALCDGQLVAINPDCSIRMIYDLQDVPAALDKKGGRLTLRYVDGHEETLPV